MMEITEKYIKKIETPVALKTKDLAVYYGKKKAFAEGTIAFPQHQITALIGPSGCGKSTFLRSLNRMNDGIARVEGQIMYHGLDINNDQINIYELRKHIGMVFQHPNPFYKSIRENITYARMRLIKTANNFQVASSNDYVLPGQLQWNPIFYYLMNQQADLIRFQRGKWKIHCRN